MALSDTERETLRCVVDHIIPPSAEHGVPGAGDPAIFADIVQSAEGHEEELHEALRIVGAYAGGPLSPLSRAEQVSLLARFRAEQPVLAGVIAALAARCYYRDGRVMESIGMEARPPYPLGYKVEPGDLSLLEPVRARGRKYRDAG